MVNADGVDPFAADRGRPIPDLKACTLIGKIGNGEMFKIGLNQTPIVGKQSGKLVLGVNDSNFGDNAGQFEAGIRIE